MKLTLKTAPIAEPVSKTDAKLHLRLATDAAGAAAYTAEDDLLDRLITAARKYVEFHTGRALIDQTWYGYLDEFPEEDYIIVPKPPLQTATLDYTDEDSTTTSLTTFDTDTDSTPGRLVLQPDEDWPTDTLYPVNPIKIEFECGYGAAGTSVPEEIIQAMLLMISDLYENRGEILIGVTYRRIRRAIDALLDEYVIREQWG